MGAIRLFLALAARCMRWAYAAYGAARQPIAVNVVMPP
jgi:hypothetical protein